MPAAKHQVWADGVDLMPSSFVGDGCQMNSSNAKLEILRMTRRDTITIRSALRDAYPRKGKTRVTLVAQPKVQKPNGMMA